MSEAPRRVVLHVRPYHREAVETGRAAGLSGEPIQRFAKSARECRMACDVATDGAFVAVSVNGRPVIGPLTEDERRHLAVLHRLLTTTGDDKGKEALRWAFDKLAEGAG